MKKYKINIVTSEPFPNGLAATNRIKTYGRGFKELGNDIEILCLRPHENYFNNKNITGVLEGIKFKYLPGRTIKRNSFFGRRFDIIVSYLNLIKHYLDDTNKPDFIIYYSTYVIPAIILWFMGNIKKIIILKEESEFRIKFNKKKYSIRYYSFIISYYLFDGLLLMTRPLIDHFRYSMKYHKPILHVPMTVDFNRFENIKKQECNYIAYCGSVNNKKDGINVLIDSFCMISNKYPNLYLRLIGEPANLELENEYKKQIKKYNLENRIVMEGYVEPKKIPQLLTNAKILVLSRPRSIQADGGFPTKLGEYLATGNPVIVTDTGEITSYLTDGENAFVVKPDSAVDFSERIIEVLDNYDEAKKIGIKGKDIVYMYFNYKIQAKKIIGFVEGLH